jgi:hypothetical protein
VLPAERIRILRPGFIYRSGELTDLELTDEVGRTATINPEKVDIMADNGFIHGIDKMVPPHLPDVPE